MRRAARADRNQQALVQMMREVGASVHLTHTLGQGFPDAVVGFRGRNYLVKFKARRGKLTADERAWHGAWRGQVAVVRRWEDVAELLEISGGGIASSTERLDAPRSGRKVHAPRNDRLGVGE